MALPYKAACWPTVTNFDATKYPERLRYLGDITARSCVCLSHVASSSSLIISC